MSSDTTLVIGAGISGLSTARVLQDRGIAVRVLERGRVSGGRMASREWLGRRIDLGAAYFTAEDDTAFGAVVRDWLARGLAREWTDTFSVAGPDGITEVKSGPIRYASPTGLRSLVADLATGLDVAYESPVDVIDAVDAIDVVGAAAASASRPTILAMPDPQARRLLAADSPVLASLDDGDAWEPTIAVAFRWDVRLWPADVHGVFVNESDAIGFIADDGDRRGDGAPVLVVHSTADLARRHLDDPSGAVPAMLEATRRVLSIESEPVDSYVHRWNFARPAAPHEAPFLLDRGVGVGVCGDGWGGRSSVGAAWESGRALAAAIADGSTSR